MAESWDPEGYQGKREEQVAFSSGIASAGLLLFSALSFVAGLYYVGHYCLP